MPFYPKNRVKPTQNRINITIFTSQGPDLAVAFCEGRTQWFPAVEKQLLRDIAEFLSKMRAPR